MEPTFFKRTGTLLLAGLLAATGCSSSSTKEATVPGSLSGTVTGSGSAAVAGVIVTTNPAKVPATTTDSSGKYSLDLPPGDYTVSFAADNYEPASASATVSAGASTTLDQTLTASTLTVSVSVPAALKNGGPAGFNTSVSGISATAKLAGSDVTSGSTITWTVKDYYGISDPPGGATASPATGATTGFAIADFETLRQAANDWLNTRYGLAATADKSDFVGYVQAPERDQLISLGVQQLRAMSFKVIATVKNGDRTSTGSAIIAPATITNGGNYQPLGMMVVANAPSTSAYAWTLGFLPMTATSETYTDATSQLQGATTKNPTLVPMETGVYKLTNGTDAPLYFRVSTYHGAPSETDTSVDGTACIKCHAAPYALTDKFDAWSNSAHGNFNWMDPTKTPMSLFQMGIDGGEGPHYSESCISCHVVGYAKVPTAANKGFDDRMAADSWTFPTVPATLTEPGNFAAMPADLKAMGAIQCENCHGPLEPTEHSQPEGIPSLFARPLSPVASMNAGVCIVCHDALSNHDKGPLWATSGHANTDLALEEATAEGRGTGVDHCGRCHAGEGFVAYVAQQQTGAPGAWDVIARPATLKSLLCDIADTASPCTAIALPNTTSPRACIPAPPAGQAIDPNCICAASNDWKAAGLTDPTKLTGATSKTCYNDPENYNYLKNTVGLSASTVHSQTCQTCHDPHSTTLRVDGDTQTTAGLFRVQNVGAGALCMVCHNSRSAAIKQGDAAISSWSRLGPHNACQGDMFAGRNAFFIPNLSSTDAPTYLPNIAKHATYLPDACATCHVKMIPSDIQAQYKPAGTNHTFKSSLTICMDCHGTDLGAQVQSGISDKMSTLTDALSGVLSAKLLKAGFDTAAKSRTNPDDGTALTDPASLTIAAADVQAIVAVENNDAVIVVPKSGAAWAKFQVGLDKINGVGSTKSLFDLTEANTQTTAKAYFNLLFVADDGAKGIHNPAFANEVLDSAANALNGVVIP